MNKVLVTGASGFVGRHVCESFIASGFAVTGTTRSSGILATAPNFDVRVTGDFDASIDWRPALQDIDYVVHLAARVHVMKEAAEDSLAEFRRANTLGTLNLAESAAAAEVKRLIYVSTIKVHGEKTEGQPFHITDRVAPRDAYAISKFGAEEALRRVSGNTSLDTVILRPPLVYGPGVRGNLLALVNLVKNGFPLPLAAVKNYRDLVSIYNLCDLISVCILHPAAPSGTFLVSDNESISTPQLIRYIAKGLGRSARLFSLPTWVLKIAAALVGKIDMLEKLTGNLQVDISATQKVLGWNPPLTVAESFQKMFNEG